MIKQNPVTPAISVPPKSGDNNRVTLLMQKEPKPAPLLYCRVTKKLQGLWHFQKQKKYGSERLVLKVMTK